MTRNAVLAGLLVLPLVLSACQTSANRQLTDSELKLARENAARWAATWDADVVVVAPIDFGQADGWVSATVQPRQEGQQAILLQCPYRQATSCETVEQPASVEGGNNARR